MISAIIHQHNDLEHLTVDAFLDFYWTESIQGASLVGLDNKWICPNPKLCSLLGYPASRLEQMTWMDVTIEPDRKENLDAVASVIRGELPYYVMDKTYQTRTGSRILVRLTVKPIDSMDRKVAILLSQIQEIDGQPVRAKDELRVIYDFLADRWKRLGSVVAFYTIAVALAGEGAINWIMAIIEAFTRVGSG